MRRLLIFDLDGTLVDSLEDIRYALNTALAEAGFAEHDSDKVRSMVGHGLSELVKSALPPGSTELIRDRVLGRVRAIYKDVPYRFTKPYPGIVPLIEDLKKRGDALAVLTNKAQLIAALIVEHFFPTLFDIVQGEEPDLPRKPDPRTVHRVLSRLKDMGVGGLKKENSVFVGDGDADVQTAANSGLRCIAVSWGFRTIDELRAAGAIVVANNAAELSERLSEPEFM